MNDKTKDNYLWNRSGSPDPEIEKLEEILRPLRDQSSGPLEPWPDGEEASSRRPLHRLRTGFLVTAATVLIVALLGWKIFDANSRDTNSSESKEANLEESKETGTGPKLIVDSSDRQLHVDEFLETREIESLSLAEIGEISVDAGSRIRVDRLSEDRTRLFLERGAIDANIYVNVKPRFFEVATQATLCVDLGCMYRLEVGASGRAKVRVYTGQVAFVDADREIYVPAGATCTAIPGRGAGIPRFDGLPSRIVSMLDQYGELKESESKQRLKLARALMVDLAGLTSQRHSLIVWHFLEDKDEDIAKDARHWLEGKFMKPTGILKSDSQKLDANDREAWKSALEIYWR